MDVQVLEHVRWTPDPWAAVANEYTAGGGGGAGGWGQTGRGGAGGGGGSGLPPALAATMSSVHAGALAPHPDADMFLSGVRGFVLPGL